MIFKDNFYSIESHTSEGNEHLFAIRIDGKHRVFEGHFPGNPVTPGVVQLEIIKELLGELIQVPLRMKTMANCKFLAILNPETDAAVTVALKVIEEDVQHWKVTASIQNEANTYLKMGASYQSM